MTKKNKLFIAWEKWADPYCENLDEFEEPDYVPEEDGQLLSPPQQIQKGMKFIMTPMGVVPLAEHSVPSKVFNFWVGHTNFPITYNVRDIIENIEGVEILCIFTKYRMRIGVGKLFNSGKVRQHINNSLDKYLAENNDQTSP